MTLSRSFANRLLHKLTKLIDDSLTGRIDENNQIQGVSEQSCHWQLNKEETNGNPSTLAGNRSIDSIAPFPSWPL